MNHLLLTSNQVAHQKTSKMADPQCQMYKRNPSTTSSQIYTKLTKTFRNLSTQFNYKKQYIEQGIFNIRSLTIPPC